MGSRAVARWRDVALGWVVTILMLAVPPTIAGTPVGEALSAGAILVAISVPAGLLWVVARGGRASGLESIGMGLTLAVAVVSLVTVALGSLHWVSLPWWAYTLGGAAGVALVWTLRGPIPVPTTTRSQVLASVVGYSGAVILLVQSLSKLPLYPQVPIDRVERDIYLNAAVGSSSARDGIHGSGIMDGVGARYHWLAYTLNDWLSQQAHMSTLASMVRVIPTLCIVALACLSAGWLLRRSRSDAGLVLGTLAILVGTSLDFSPWGRFLVGSPSQELGTVFLIGLVLLTSRFVTGRRTVPLVLAMGLLAATLMATKVTLGAMACFGVVCLVAASVRGPRDRLKAAAIAAAIILISTGVAFALVESGQPSSGELTWRSLPTDGTLLVSTLYGLVVAGAIAVGTQIAKWIGLGYLLVLPGARRSPITLWGLGGLLFAFLGFLLVAGTGNQLWFVEAGSIVAAAASALGGAYVLRDVSRKHGRSSAWSAVALGFLAGLIVAGSAMWTSDSSIGSTRPYLIVLIPLGVVAIAAVALSSRWDMRPVRRLVGAATLVGLSAAIVMPFAVVAYRAVTQPAQAPAAAPQYFFGKDAVLDDRGPNREQDIADAGRAADWLRSTADPNDVVATAVPITTWLPALTGLDMYAANREMVALWLPRGSIQEFDRRQAVVERYAQNGDRDAKADLCADGVRWLWRGASDTPPGVVEGFRSGRILVEDLCSSGG